MVKQDALMESLSSNLHGFLNQIQGGLSVPDKKFLRDGFIGLVRSGHPIVCQMAREVPNQGSKYITRVKRLDLHLTAESDFDEQLKQSIPAIWVPLVTGDTPLILDLSDLAKPLAEKMDYLATVRDGSTGKLVNGYWLVEMYASVGRKNPFPILLEPFSHEEPECPGQNPIVIDAVHRVFTLTDGRGVLVVDRGGDSRVLLDDWLDNAYRFVVRLRGDRDLMRFYAVSERLSNDGQWVPVEGRALAEHTPTPHHWSRVVKSKGRVVLRISQIGWVKVRLPGREETLTMVVARSPGSDVPFMLLTNLAVEMLADAKRVLRFYIRRWECEEGMQFLKEQVDMEAIRTFRWTAICRLVLLSAVVMLYLAWLWEKHLGLAERLIDYAQVLPGEVNFMLYRLLTGLTHILNACFYIRRALL
jgi:hypothetical protein